MAKSFNVTLIQPPGYGHSLALKEAAEYLHFMLIECGFESRLSSNYFSRDHYNVILCAHLLGESYLSRIPPDSVIFNSEQLEDTAGWHFASGVYARLLERFHVWDYSQANLDRIGHPRKALIPFLYCRELARTDLRRTPGRALLFYGVMTERRKRILQAIHGAGVPVTALFGQYGAQRDAEMFRSMAVLNLHKSDDTSLFEPIRCFYPLINQVPVISEEVARDAGADPYRDAMCFLGVENFAGEVITRYGRLEEWAEELIDRALRFRETSAVSAVAAAVKQFLGEVSAG